MHHGRTKVRRYGVILVSLVVLQLCLTWGLSLLDNIASSASHNAMEIQTSSSANFSKMEETNPKKLPRMRKPNFSVAEENLLTEEVSKNFDLLHQKFSKAVTNQQKKAMWSNIAEKINTLGVAVRTPDEVRDKWRNKTAKAKTAFTNQRAEMRNTGGGPAPTPLDSGTEAVISLYQDSATFTGITGGLETEIHGESTVESIIQSPGPAGDQCVNQPTCNRVPLSPVIVIHNNVSNVAESTAAAESRSTEKPLNQNKCMESTKKRKGVTTEDINELQFQVLQGQLEEQKLKKETLKLQIQILKKFNDSDIGFEVNPQTLTLLSALNQQY